MNKITLFDIISDSVIWQCDLCHNCDGILDLDSNNPHDEIVLRAYRGQFGHLVIQGYHASCWNQQWTTWSQLTAHGGGI
jgi:hypothetical protein